LDIGHRTYQVSVRNFAGSASTVPRGVLDDPDLYCDTNALLGATYAPEGTMFRVFAPTARRVQVVLYDAATGDQGRQIHVLQAAAKGIWEGMVSGDLKGKFYMLSLDGENLSPDREVLDIYSVNAVNSSHRARITDLHDTNPPDWEAAKAGPRVSSAADMVVYEIHVRDFSIAENSGMEHKGRYLAFTEAGTHLADDPAIKTGLDNLTELGITHVQLMPLQDFENDETSTNYNWGYVTMAYNSPEGWFATDINNDSRVREFKLLVQALHQRGIGVIMDVVYNHTAASAPFNFLVPRYYYRYLPDGANSNGSGCGNDFRSEAPMGRKYFIDSLTYWAREYGVDGFRFDLMALMDIDTMKQAESALREINPNIVLYGEPWGGGGKSAPVHGTDKRSIRGTSIGAFNDNIRNALIGSPFNKTSPGFVQNGSHASQVEQGLAGSWEDWAPTPAQAINYMSCHDNYTIYDKLKLSKPGATDAEINDMMKVGYLLLFTAQGVPFIQGGEEFARNKDGHENSYNAPDSVNEIDWSLKKKNLDLFTYVRDVIAIRKAHPVFRLRAKEQIAAWLKFHETGDPNLLMYTLDGSNLPDEPWNQICVVVNVADRMSSDVSLPEGTWHVAFDSNGLADNRTVEKSLHVRYKSGMILYQQ
jgi:pullulanase